MPTKISRALCHTSLWLLCLALGVCQLLPASGEARLVSEDPNAASFPSDLAFASSDVIPLDASLPPAVMPGASSFTVTQAGVTFAFTTASPSGLLKCSGPGRTGCVVSSSDIPIIVTISPPVAAVGIVGVDTECGFHVTVVGSSGTEDVQFAPPDRGYPPPFFPTQPVFIGGAEIGDISAIVMRDDLCSGFAVWDDLRFVKSGGGPGPVPSIPLPVLQAEVSGAFRGVAAQPFCVSGTQVNLSTGSLCGDGVPGTVEAITIDSPPAVVTSQGHAVASVPGTQGSASRATSPPPLPLFSPPEPPSSSAAKASKTLRFVATFSGPSTPPAIVPIDMFVHVDGVLSTERVAGVIFCGSACPDANMPGIPVGTDLVAQVVAQIKVFTSSGETTPFNATASLVNTSLSASGPWTGDFDLLVRVGGGVFSTAEVFFTEMFPALFSVPLGDTFAMEIVLRTDAFANFVSTRFISGAKAD